MDDLQLDWTPEDFSFFTFGFRPPTIDFLIVFAARLREFQKRVRECVYLLTALKEANESARTGVILLMEAILTDSYGRMESFAEDLWVSTVNNGPKSLSENVVSINDVRKEAKNIPVTCLSDYDYDLSDKMGRLLRDQKKVEFDSLEKIKKAYTDTFGRMHAFEDDNFQTLRALSLLRNSYSHDDGIVTNKFVRAAKDLPGVSAFKEGDRIPTDGSFLPTFAGSTTRFCVGLLFAMNVYLDDGFIQGLGNYHFPNTKK